MREKVKDNGGKNKKRKTANTKVKEKEMSDIKV